MKTMVKVCGITRLEDALVAVEFGADALGFIFYPGSKRYISFDHARHIIERLPPFIVKVGVFVEESVDNILKAKEYCMLDRVQLYAEDENIRGKVIPGITIMAFRIRDREDVKRAQNSEAFPLLDSYHERQYGGSGARFNWELLKDFGRPFILAGGINAGNIEEALEVKPYAIDIASGVESFPGIKDPDKMAKIFERIERVR